MAEGNRVVRPRTLPERKGQRAEQARALPPQLRPYLVGALVLPIVAALYWAQSVLMPVAVALLLSFLLGPPVRALQRTGLGSTRAGRVLSVVLVVMLVSSVLGGISYVVAQQIVMLSHDLPQYRGNLRQKIADLRGVRKPGTLKEVQSTASEVLSEFQKQEPPKREPVPVPVTVKNESVGFVHVPKLLDAVTSAGFVIVLVIFMLIEQRDLRNRLIRLTGHGRLAITTRALGDANTRITRYVLVQTVINLGYGMAIGLGLYVIGLPYVVLWGFLAFALRFVPYIGPLMAAVAPVAVSLAVFPGWPRPLLTVGLFLVVEALTYVVIEPLLYRQALGLSQTALFVAIAFWTWLWGPIGLLLATPLTVCLVVLGKHVPALGFLTILMADGEPVLRSDVSYYQRLLARDEAEANDIVRAYLERHAREDVCDDILLPALSHAKRDREMKRLTDDEVQAVYQGARETIAELVATPLFSPGGSDGERHARESQDPPAVSEQPQVQGCVAGDEASEMALVMLAYLLRPHAITLEAGSAHALPGEVLSQVAEKSPAIVCVASIRPGDLAQTRYLCKRLRARFPHVKILVARWSEKDDGEQDELLTSGADAVAASLRQARDQIREYARLASPAPVVSPDEESQVFRLPHVTRHLGRQAPAGEGPSTDTWFP
jgi:predicted PurR-regulated permease PerM